MIRMGAPEPIRWNSASRPCADCGRTVEPESGYQLYADEGTKILCPSCYQQRLARDRGGSTHDLTAEVDGGSG